MRAPYPAIPLLLTLAWPIPVLAQTINLQPGGLAPTRTLPSGASVSPRDQNKTPLGINYSDCISDLRLTFSATLTGFTSGQQLQAWAGTLDCRINENRQSQTAKCWPLLAQSIGLQANISVDIRAQDIVSRILDSGPAPTYTPAAYTVCSRQTTAGATNVGVYFVWLDGALNALSGATSAVYNVPVSTRGPDAPGAPSAGVEDTALLISWPTVSDPNMLGFRVYCDPPPGQEGVDASVVTTDAQTGSTDATMTRVCPDTGVTLADSSVEDGAIDASVDSGCYWLGMNAVDSSVVGSGCPSRVLLSGVDQASIDPKYICGSADRTQAEMRLGGLKNNVMYTIAIAAYDVLDNAGPISAPTCEMPGEVVSFWKVYRDAGGLAGGCALEGVGLPADVPIGLLVLAGATFGLVRRRRAR